MTPALDSPPVDLRVSPISHLVRSLHRIEDDAQLWQEVPDLAARLGFDRVIASRVEGLRWRPVALHVSKDPAWARDILEAGRRTPTPLGAGLVEDRMMKTLSPIQVGDVQGNAKVNKAIALASRSTAFLAAPILVSGGVGGFLHVDRYWSQAQFDVQDAAALQGFADALGLCLERLRLRRRLREASASQARVVVTSSASTALPCKLTRREAEVARLIADGLTNPQIAEALVVELSTVKSHVKHILRKLGARHRAELVSMYLRAAG